MAYNHEASAADGTSPLPTTTGTPGARPNADVALVPCCSGNCCLSGCLSNTNLCPNCYAECLKERGNPRNVSNMQKAAVDPPAEAEQAADASLVETTVPVMADISDLHAVLKSKSSPSRHDSRGIRYTSTQLSDSSATARPVETPSSTVNCNLRSPQPQPYEERILSPLFLSPRQSSGSLMQTPARQQAANRCVACRKRLGLLGFKCRCGDLFCAPHRYSDKHDCSFDYKAAGRLAIAKENPVVKASKIDRI